MVWQTWKESRRVAVSMLDAMDWERRSHAFAHLAAFSPWPVNITGRASGSRRRSAAHRLRRGHPGLLRRARGAAAPRADVHRRGGARQGTEGGDRRRRALAPALRRRPQGAGTDARARGGPLSGDRRDAPGVRLPRALRGLAAAPGRRRRGALGPQLLGGGAARAPAPRPRRRRPTWTPWRPGWRGTIPTRTRGTAPPSSPCAATSSAPPDRSCSCCWAPSRWCC